MAFGTQDDTDDVMNEINMTPMVDIMLVLLIIFIVTVPVMKHAINIDLPQASNTRLQTKPEAVRLNVDADGTAWIAAHAKVLALGRHFGNAKNLAPTQVFKFTPEAKGDARLVEVYLNAGEQISAGSVGAVFNRKLLIGSITEHKLLQCHLP